MRFLITILLLAALRLPAAVGDLIGLEVETNGWVLRATISGLNTNGNFFNGFGTNNSLTGTQALTLTVTAPGFTDLGVSQAVSRLVYGTKVLRAAYPMENTNDIQPQAGDCVARIALSDSLMINDTITASGLAGYYAVTNGNGTNATAFSAQSVTNSSTNTYSKVIGKWTWPQHIRITNNTMTARATCFQLSAQEASPVRTVAFSLTATQTTIPIMTNWVTAPVIDSTMPDTLPVIEYVATFDISTVSNGSPLRLDFAAYPWMGDSNAVLSTWTDTRVGESQPAPQTNLCDRLMQYNSFAVVASYGTASGVVSTNVLDTNSPPAAFNTVSNAMWAMRKTNALMYGMSWSNLACGIIYFDAGDHFISCGNSFNQWGEGAFQWAPYPTNGALPVNLTTNLGTSLHFSPYLHVKGLHLWLTNVDGLANHHSLWLDQCSFFGGSAFSFRINTNTYFTHCQMFSLASGLAPVSTAGALLSVPLVRGNTIWTNSKAIEPYCIVGNEWKQTNSLGVGCIGTTSTILGCQSQDGAVIAFNKIRQTQSANNTLSFGSMSMTGGTSNRHYGVAIVQNLIEIGHSTAPAMWIGADSTTNDVNNVLLWNNTVVGQRSNLGYNDVGVTPRERLYWSKLGNIEDAAGIKTDTFPTASGTRIGNWSEVYSVGSYGNWRGGITGIGSSTFFYEAQAAGWKGLNSFQALVAADGQKFRNRLCFDGTTGGPGGGDYRLRNDSPLWALKTRQVLPYDIEGNARSASDPPGAFAARVNPFTLTGKGALTGKGGAQ